MDIVKWKSLDGHSWQVSETTWKLGMDKTL